MPVVCAYQLNFSFSTDTTRPLLYAESVVNDMSMFCDMFVICSKITHFLNMNLVRMHRHHSSTYFTAPVCIITAGAPFMNTSRRFANETQRSGSCRYFNIRLTWCCDGIRVPYCLRPPKPTSIGPVFTFPEGYLDTDVQGQHRCHFPYYTLIDHHRDCPAQHVPSLSILAVQASAGFVILGSAASASGKCVTVSNGDGCREARSRSSQLCIYHH